MPPLPHPTPPLPQDSPFTVLIGGFHRCDPSWNRDSDGSDCCFKLYYPVLGEARLTLDAHQMTLHAGKAYLIPGYHLRRQECSERMDVYWLHFVPQSLHLRYLLSRMTHIHLLDGVMLKYWRATCLALPKLLESRGDENPIRTDPQPSMRCRKTNKHSSNIHADSSRPSQLFYRVQAMLMDIVASALESFLPEYLSANDPIFERMQPAITFMDRHFLENPPLGEIAKTVHLAPNYFHRRFTAAFSITPFGYMLERRLNLGRQLLLSTNFPLSKIAEQTGFGSEFHFSKTFKKHCRLSPRQFRRRAMP
jgi:AraC-like DNA-binding protein